MADSNSQDHPEIVEPEEPGTPDPDRTEAGEAAPAAHGRAWSTRRTLWGSSLAVVAIVAAITAVNLNERGGSHRPHPSPTAPSGAATPTRPSRPALPLSAVHDAHGLIVTLPDIRRILGPTPLPGVTLSDNRLINKKIAQFDVSEETNGGYTNSPSRYRDFIVRLSRFPSVGSINDSYGKVGPGSHHMDAHNWTGPATSIAGLNGHGLVYQFSNGPYEAAIPNNKVELDYRGAKVEAQFRNVAIYISFESADITLTKSRNIRVTYPPYNEMRDELVDITRKITSHL